MHFFGMLSAVVVCLPGTFSPAAGHGTPVALGLQCGRVDEPGVSILLGRPQVQLQAVGRCLHRRLAAAQTGVAHTPSQTVDQR